MVTIIKLKYLNIYRENTTNLSQKPKRCLCAEIAFKREQLTIHETASK